MAVVLLEYTRIFRGGDGERCRLRPDDLRVK